MPRPVKISSSYGKTLNRVTRETISQMVAPLSVYSRAESSAFVRQALAEAIGQVHVPTQQAIDQGVQFQRSNDQLTAIRTEEHRKTTATLAASNLRNARVLLEQAEVVGDSVRPILCYYGGLSLLNFITSCVVRRERVGNPGHGLSVTCDSEGWDFDRNWPRQKCRVEMHPSGDFPFLVDALTVAGWPSLFSGYLLHYDHETDSWEARENPAPLLSEKVSLDLLCNFDYNRFSVDHLAIRDWLPNETWPSHYLLTCLLMDFVVMYVASSLARYYIPAWQQIIAAEKSAVYNDIRSAYTGIVDGLPYYFEDKEPFRSHFGTRIE